MPSLEGTKGSEVTQDCMNPFKTRYLGYIFLKKKKNSKYNFKHNL